MPELNTQYQTPEWLRGDNTMSGVESGFRTALMARDQIQQEKIQNLQAVRLNQDNRMEALKIQQTLEQRQKLLGAQELLNKTNTEAADYLDKGDPHKAIDSLLSAGIRNPVLFNAPEFNSAMTAATKAAQAKTMLEHYRSQAEYQNRMATARENEVEDKYTLGVDKLATGGSADKQFAPSPLGKLLKEQADAKAAGNTRVVGLYDEQIRNFKKNTTAQTTAERDIFLNETRDLLAQKKLALNPIFAATQPEEALKLSESADKKLQVIRRRYRDWARKKNQEISQQSEDPNDTQDMTVDEELPIEDSAVSPTPSTSMPTKAESTPKKKLIFQNGNFVPSK